MTAEQQARVLKLLDDAEKWVDDNRIIEDGDDDQPGDVMYNGFVYLLDMVKIKKGIE